MSDGVLRVERDGPVARVTFTRSEVRNAFNAELIDSLAAVFAGFAHEPAESLRAVILAGEGPSFCAGADIEWMRAAASMSEEANRADAGRMAAMLNLIDTCPAPVVARVHGAALGGGVGLCAVSDIVLATRDTVFGFTETKLGLIPSVISLFVLPKIGETWARALYPGGSRFDAERAREIGLVHAVVADEQALDRRLADVVDELLSVGPNAARAAKALVRELRGLSPQDSWSVAVSSIAAQRVTAEAQEGLSAFLGKRPARWRRPPGT